MGALSHFIERHGVATTGISLVRPHTEQLRPPRALWVPFPLGRPLGNANDPDFQLDVLHDALRLLETATEPTIADYPHDADPGADLDGWACPVALAAPEPRSEAEALAKHLVAELRLLQPWYQEARRARGRTAFGVSGAAPEDAEDLAIILAAGAAGEAMPENPDTRFYHPMPTRLRYIADDLKAYYQEAVAAQPGQRRPSADALNRWLFHQTALGETLYRLRERAAASDDNAVRWMQGALIPGAYARRPEG